MRIKSIALCTASLAALTFAAPAAAQDQQTPVDPNVQAQTNPADPAQGSPQTDDAVAEEGQTIVVTGLRRSLESAQNIKRQSDQIVDVVVAEDIGKLPDRNVSEALARVPGVTVERRVGEAGDVFIRGLRDPATTYNGRDIFTAEQRTVAPQDFPAGGVAALEVYKSLTAEQVEGNLAGQINVRSRRPFDFRGLELSGSANLTYTDLAEDYDFNGNLLISNRWDTSAGEIGVLVNGSYTGLEYQDSIRFVSGDFFTISPDPARPGVFTQFRGSGAEPAGSVRVPNSIGLFQAPGRRVRPSVNAAIQWRPSPGLEFYVDGLYQGFRRQVADRGFFVDIISGDPASTATFTNVTTRSGTRYAEGLRVSGQPQPLGFQAGTREETNTYQVAVGGSYDIDQARFTFDVARSDSTAEVSIYSVDYALRTAPPFNVVFDTPQGDGGVAFDFGGYDTTNLDNYVYRGFFDRHVRGKGGDWQARADGEFREVASFIESLQFGVRFTTRDAEFGDGDRYSPVPISGPNVRAYGSLPLDFALTRDGYRDNVPQVRQLILPTYESIRGSISELRTIAGFPQGRPPFNPRTTYDVNEKSYAGYGQLNYRFDAGAVRLDGALGLRVVKTEFGLQGTNEEARPGLPPRLVPLTIEQTYTDYLPNASIRARFTDQLQLRAAYTQTRTRPSFIQLNPGLIIDPPGGSPIRTGRGGNPNLEPVNSDNYDLSLEYYFTRTGFASVALFRRDVSGFITDFITPTEVEGFGIVNVFGPANAGQGRLQGVEAQFRTFFDFGFLPRWARGFGTELNFTYIDNTLDPTATTDDDGPDIEIPNVSKYTYNIVGFYENGPLTARLAYNFRSDYAQFFVANPSGSFAGEFVGDVSRLDASISYALSENITIAADASNLLGKPFRNFRTIEPGIISPRDVRFEDRVFSLGVRFRL